MEAGAMSDLVNPAQLKLVAQMRAIAIVLERFNDLYDYHRTRGTWSPSTLRYEADYLRESRERRL
jgi:hypothetical protein